MNDPIADMLTRIRNAARSRKKTVTILNNKVCRGIADVLVSEGYVAGYTVEEDGKQGLIQMELKYGPRGEAIIHVIKRESTPGRRIYRGSSDLPSPKQGLGISIVSTSRGVLSDRKAREEKIGGELLATVE